MHYVVILLFLLCTDTCRKEKYSDKNHKLIVSDITRIVSIDLDNTTVVEQYKGVQCRRVYAVEYDLVNKMIYWSEVDFGLIRRVSFDNSFNGSAVETIVTGLRHPEQIAVDWVNRKLYWTDYQRRVVERSDLDGSNIELVANGIVVQAIAIDPFHETIYWSNFLEQRIERILPFEGISYKVTDTYTPRPSGLTIDYDNNLLYWTDRHYSRILSCDLKGGGLKSIPVSVPKTDPYAITVFQSNLYWTDPSNSSVFIANQFTGRTGGRISTPLNQPTDVHVLDSSRQPGACKLYCTYCSLVLI